MIVYICIHFPTNDITSFFFLVHKNPKCVCILHVPYQFLSSWTPWLVPCLTHWAEGWVNTVVTSVSVLCYLGVLWVKARSDIAGPYATYNFSSLRYHHTLESWLTISVYIYLCQPLLLIFLMNEILTVVRWNLNVVLTCVSLNANEVELFFHVYWLFIF